MRLKSGFELLPVVGAVILFFSWVFQQSVVEGANQRLNDIASAEDMYRIYQSHNAVFNAVIATQTNAETISKIRGLQIYEYASSEESVGDVGLR